MLHDHNYGIFLTDMRHADVILSRHNVCIDEFKQFLATAKSSLANADIIAVMQMGSLNSTGSLCWS